MSWWLLRLSVEKRFEAAAQHLAEGNGLNLVPAAKDCVGNLDATRKLLTGIWLRRIERDGVRGVRAERRIKAEIADFVLQQG